MISISCKLFHFSRFGVEVFENSSEALTSKVSKIRLVSIGDESKMVVFYVFLKHELLICFAYSTHLAAALSFFPNWYARAQIPLSAFLHFLFCTLLPLERERNTVSRTTLMKLPLFAGWGWKESNPTLEFS